VTRGDRKRPAPDEPDTGFSPSDGLLVIPFVARTVSRFTAQLAGFRGNERTMAEMG